MGWAMQPVVVLVAGREEGVIGVWCGAGEVLDGACDASRTSCIPSPQAWPDHQMPTPGPRTPRRRDVETGSALTSYKTNGCPPNGLSLLGKEYFIAAQLTKAAIHAWTWSKARAWARFRVWPGRGGGGWAPGSIPRLRACAHACAHACVLFL